MKTQNRYKILLQWYQQIPVPFKMSLWYIICSFLQRGISMLTTPVFTRLLSKEQYGIVSTYNAWQNLLILITTLSLYKGMMNLYVRHENKEKILSSVCGLSLSLTLIWLICVIFILDFISKILALSRVLVICLFISFVFQAVWNCWVLYKRYVYDYKNIVYLTLIQTVFTSLLSILCVVFIKPTAEQRILPQTIIASLIGVALYIKAFIKGKCFFDKDIWLFSISFCGALLPHYLSEFVLQSSDKLMINYMCGVEDVAIYSIAYAIGTLISLLTGAINSSLAPYRYQKLRENEYEKLAKVSDEVALLVALVLFIIILFRKEIVLIFGGNKYAESEKLITPICIGAYFNYIFQFFATVQEYFERKLAVAIPSMSCAILNIILNYVFIKKYGYSAAAYTTFISYVIFCFIHFLFYRNLLKEGVLKQNIYHEKNLLIISSLVVLAGIIPSVVQVSWRIRLLLFAFSLMPLLIKTHQYLQKKSRE